MSAPTNIGDPEMLRADGIAPECGGVLPSRWPAWLAESAADGQNARSDYTNLQLPAGEKDDQTTGKSEIQSDPDRRWILPSGEMSFEAGSKPFFVELARRDELFLQDTKIVEVDCDKETGEAQLLLVDHSTLRSRVELVGDIWEWRKRGESYVLARGRCSEEVAKGMMKTRAKNCLNTIRVVLRCPIITQV